MLSYPLEITTSWNSQFNFRGTTQIQYPLVNEQSVRYSSTNFEVSTTQTFRILDWLDTELVAAYFSPYHSGFMYMIQRINVEMGLRKTFSSGIGISLNVYDVFDTGSQWPMYADVPGTALNYKWLFDGEGPVFRLHVSIPIGSKSDRQPGRRSGSSEEQRRL